MILHNGFLSTIYSRHRLEQFVYAGVSVLLWWMLKVTSSDKDYIRLTRFKKTSSRKVILRRDHLKPFGGSMETEKETRYWSLNSFHVKRIVRSVKQLQ